MIARLLVRSSSLAALTIEVCAVAVTVGGAARAPLWRLGLGYRFWREFAEQGAMLAFVGIFASALLAMFQRPASDVNLREIQCLLCLNIAAIVLALFVPAIAAV